jgi:hypothetical protein
MSDEQICQQLRAIADELTAREDRTRAHGVACQHVEGALHWLATIPPAAPKVA